MQHPASRSTVTALRAALLLMLLSSVTESSEPTTMHAKGTFDVKLTPQQADNPDARGAGVSRISLMKQFHGGLDGSSHGEMLALGDGTRSGAYVALETFSGKVDGRKGTFSLVHRAAMRNSVPEGWTVTVVPDSGTDELAGIEGALTITITGGKHFYEFEYTLPGR